VIGIVNVTPDSFSDGGRFATIEAAVEYAKTLVQAGADVLDVGGESTRPGAEGVTTETEICRVVPVIKELARQLPAVMICVDTSKPAVAEAALAAGASIVNDVTAGRATGMFELIGKSNAGIILMHMRGDPRSMQIDTGYDDVVAEVFAFLRERAQQAHAAGIRPECILLDPGIGFGKDLDGNLALIAALPDLVSLGFGVVLGVSRKSFIGTLTGAVVGDRLPGSLAAIASTVGLERAFVRVHDVADTVQFLKVMHAILGAK
jgi:dihydropteroate synthase